MNNVSRDYSLDHHKADWVVGNITALQTLRSVAAFHAVSAPFQLGRAPHGEGEPTCFLVAYAVASILVCHQPGDQIVNGQTKCGTVRWQCFSRYLKYFRYYYRYY